MTTVIDRIVHRWRDFQESRAALAELMEVDPQEVARMAGEYGLSAEDLGQLVAHGSHASDLMERMIRARGLDVETLRHDLPAVVADMAVLCSRCQAKARCEHELEAGTAAAHADEFCPNASTMASLQA